MLAIGGLDPGGGAGVLADARAIAHAGAYACGALSLLTVQSTSGVRSATPIDPRELIAQCDELFRVQRIAAVKVGALGSVANTRAVAELLARHRDVPSVVDTVMLPTRGPARLLDERAIAVLRKDVLRRATVVTANAPEAEVLTGHRVTRLDEARAAATELLALGPRAVLVKGGHLSGGDAVDVLAVDEGGAVRITELRAPRLRLPPLHGGGCVLASLLAARLALSPGRDNGALRRAVRWAKKAHHAALRAPADVGGEMRVLFGP